MTDLERFFRRLVANLAASDPSRLHHPLPLDDVQQSIIPYRSNRRALHIESSEDYEMILLRLCAGEGNLVRTEPETARARFQEELQSPNPDLDVLRKVEHVVISLRADPLARALSPEPDGDLPYAPPTAVPAPPIPGLDLPQLDVVEPTDQLDAPGEEPFDPERLDDAALDEDSLDQHRFDQDALDQDALDQYPLDQPLDQDALDAELLDESLPDEHVERTPQCLYCGDRLPTDRAVRFCPHCGQRQAPPECPQCHSEVEPGWRHCVSCGAGLEGR